MHGWHGSGRHGAAPWGDFAKLHRMDEPLATAYRYNAVLAAAIGTATAGRDYVATAGSLTFAPGQTRRTITVLVIGDRISEADETFRIGLASPLNATLSATANRGTGTIRNDDGPVRLAAAFASLAPSPPNPPAKRPDDNARMKDISPEKNTR